MLKAQPAFSEGGENAGAMRAPRNLGAPFYSTGAARKSLHKPLQFACSSGRGLGTPTYGCQDGTPPQHVVTRCVTYPWAVACRCGEGRDPDNTPGCGPTKCPSQHHPQPYQGGRVLCGEDNH